MRKQSGCICNEEPREKKKLSSKSKLAGSFCVPYHSGSSFAVGNSKACASRHYCVGCSPGGHGSGMDGCKGQAGPAEGSLRRLQTADPHYRSLANQ